MLSLLILLMIMIKIIINIYLFMINQQLNILNTMILKNIIISIIRLCLTIINLS